MGLRIGIDGRVFIGNKTGIGQYVSELCKALDDMLPDGEFYVYSRDPVELPVKKSNWILRTESFGLLKKMKNILWYKFISGLMCRRDRVDVCWGTGSFLPFFLGPVNSILTVYDMVYVIAPQTMYKFNLWMFRLFFKRDVRKARRITAISKGTAERLRDILDCEVDEIIYPSADKRFIPQSEEAVQSCVAKYGISMPYFLSVATWEPRKNLRLLLETFLSMKQKKEVSNYQLVLVGGRGWGDEKIAGIVGNNIRESGIIPLGYVPDGDLAPLYSGSTAFLFPSIYEGFGMPVLEARKCKVPVITSDTPELREAGGDNCIYIQPTAAGIRKGILHLLNNPQYNLNSEILNPSWEEGARQMFRVLSEAVSSHEARSCKVS